MCRFGNVEVPAVFVSSQLIHYRAPPTLPSSVELFVTNNGNDFVSFSNVTYTRHANVRSISPKRGPIDGGAKISVSGSGLSLVPNVYCVFSGVYVSVQEVSDTLLTCTAPRVEHGSSVSFQVVANEAPLHAHPLSFEYYDNPKILSVNPSMGPVKGGTVIDVYGSGFFSASDVMCFVGSSPSPRVRVVSDSLLQCTSPSSTEAALQF